MLYLCVDFYENGGKMQWYDNIEQERFNEKSEHRFRRRRVAVLAGRVKLVCASMCSVAVGILVPC